VRPLKAATPAEILHFLLATDYCSSKGMTAMGKANRLVGYLASVAGASLFYVAWFVIWVERHTMPGGDASFMFKIGLAFFFMLFSAGSAFVLMAFPWYLSVRWYDRLQRSGLIHSARWYDQSRRFGLIYFSMFGAATTLVLGCATSSLSPKPLFIEDQTFLEGFMVAIERQGICLLLTGFVFGLTFWMVSERLRYSDVHG
jgi:hypothetical protein